MSDVEALFRVEREVFEQRLPGWLGEPNNLGKWVVIQGEVVIGPIDTQRDACDAGYREFGANQPFLVESIFPFRIPVEYNYS